MSLLVFGLYGCFVYLRIMDNWGLCLGWKKRKCPPLSEAGWERSSEEEKGRENSFKKSIKPQRGKGINQKILNCLWIFYAPRKWALGYGQTVKVWRKAVCGRKATYIISLLRNGWKRGGRWVCPCLHPIYRLKCAHGPSSTSSRRLCWIEVEAKGGERKIRTERPNWGGGSGGITAESSGVYSA